MTVYQAIFQDELGGRYHELADVKDIDGMTLILSLSDGHGSDIELHFDYIAYRVTNEGDRLPTVGKLASIPGVLVYEAVFESEYIAWLMVERCGITPPMEQKFRHFMVVAEFVIDVICYDAPKFIRKSPQ